MPPKHGSHATHGGEGRWKGKLTSRPLPLDDDTIDTLTDVERRELTAVWIGRAATERRVADAFAEIRDALTELHAEPSLIALAARSIDDEYRHAELSRVVASRFAGEELDAPPLLPLEVPEHPGASPELRRTLHVVGQCSLNETTASAFLETCLAHAKAPLATAAVRELLSDEVDHARIGWSFLSTVRPALRAEIAPWLLPMTRGNLRIWRTRTSPSEASPDVLAAHGAPPIDVIDEALVGAVRDLVIPGFDALGIDTRRVVRWLERGAETN